MTRRYNTTTSLYFSYL